MRMAKDHAALHRKREFHDAMDDLINDNYDGIPDTGRLSSERALRNTAARKKPRSEASNAPSISIDRATSSTQVHASSATLISKPVSSPPHTSPAKAVPATLRRAVSAATDLASSREKVNVLPSATSSMRRPRRNAASATFSIVPMEQQIFRDLRFYFFPNTDTHPARKIRIAKAQQYGATWIRDWSDSVTHVIMDKGMDIALMLKWNNFESPPSNVVIVSEIYPAECISNRALLDPYHIQFKVKGYEAQTTAEPLSSGSTTSLKLKPAKKDVKSRGEETPKRNLRTPSPMSTASTNNDSARAPAAPPDSHSTPGAQTILSTDELDAAIQQAHELRGVPLDDDEDEADARLTSPVDCEDDQHESDPPLPEQRKGKVLRIQDKFMCMQKHTKDDSLGPNAATITILQEMADYYAQTADEWRCRAYRKAIGMLRNHPHKVQTKAEALSIPQIGERLATKIEEIAVTNRLRRLDNARAEPSDQILQTFMKVYGAGLAQATKWTSAGYKTLDDLLDKADLSHNQRIGIEHFEDFDSRIPRAEVEQHGSIVRKELHKIDPTFEVIIGGSYRRGASTSGDVDCLITRPKTAVSHIRAVVFEQLVPKLKAKGFLVAELAVSSDKDGTKWHGASALPLHDPPVWRRLDLLLVPSDELGAALIYWTGNDIFNRSLRLLASKKNMRLNQKGLYEGVMRGKGRVKLNEGTLVEGRDEKRIFEILGVPWRPPEHRVC